jgi:hypothetical protein
MQFVEGRSQSSHPPEDTLQHYRIHQINTTFLSDNQIQLSVDWTTTPSEQIQFSTLTTTPKITSEGQRINLVVQSVSGAEVPAELLTKILSPIHEILSLQDFKQRGTSFQIQQIDITADQLILHAAARIDQFPTR